MIPVFKPTLGSEELAAVQEVFASGWIGKGRQVLDFERRFAESLASDPRNFTSTNSCTEGLFLAADMYGFGPGDEVVVPAVSFVAVGSAVVASGARLVICDVDPRTLNATAELIEPCLTGRTRAVWLNHFGGVPCDLDPILNLCRNRGLLVLEDSACAPHSMYHGRAAGTFGDAGMWSFDAMKILCTGDGGMLYFSDPDRVVEARERLYLGLPDRQTSGVDSSASGADEWWRFEITRPGRRAIMNDIAGAIGCVQLRRLSQFIARRVEIHDTYVREFRDLGWLQLPPVIPDHCVSSHYFFWVQTEVRNELARFLYDNGVYSTYRYWPLNRIAYFGCGAASVPNADYATERTLNLPLHQGLTDADVGRVVDTVRAFGSSRGL
ncbi:MAG: DegT/DnrJ/EryC1/StrS family aminotransferase [Gemmatimonadetes bacterium]|nr:DegT/DnrJ/EryC1/StrS family aminotransferase [Gemmatimonadota bacterium]